MEKPVDEQIAEVKNNIRYFCNKYKWENYEVSYCHKHHHHHSKQNKKKHSCQHNHARAKLSKNHDKHTEKKTILNKKINPNDDIDTINQEKIEQKVDPNSVNVNDPKLENINEVNTKAPDNPIVTNQNSDRNNVNEIDTKNTRVLSNDNDGNRICLLSSDEESDSSFDFDEFQKFFKAQDDLYHLTKHVKHEKSKRKKQKAIVLYSDSNSESFDSDSSLDLDDYQFRNNTDFQKHKNEINRCTALTQTKDQSTNTIHKEYSTTDTQTSSRIPSSNKKIKFSAQLRANVKRSFNSLLQSSSSSGSKSYSNSGSSHYSSSRGSYDNSAQKSNSGKALSEQYASSENESSKGSSGAQNNKKNNNNLSSSNLLKKSLQDSKKNDGLNTNNISKIENNLVLIEEEEEVSDEVQNLKGAACKSEKAIKINGSIEYNQITNQDVQPLIQNKNINNNNNNLTKDSNQDIDIEKLIEEVSQNSSKIKQTVKNSKKVKKKQSSLKKGSSEADENTEAYSQIPSEFSDNIGVDSSLGYKQPQQIDQPKNEKISHAKTASNILKLEDFMEQSDNIHISSKLENEYEEPKKNYNNYGSSSDSVIDAPS